LCISLGEVEFTSFMRAPNALSLAAAGPVRLGTIKSDVAGKLGSKIRAVGGRLQRIVSQPWPCPDCYP
jgi:hypothetical protein